MQNHLLSDVGDVDLFHDWTVVEYSKGDYLRKQGRKTKHLVIIKEGTCSVQIVTFILILLYLLIFN